MIIDDAVVQKLLNYLARQPYREVQELISNVISEANKPENTWSKEPELPLGNHSGEETP